MLGYLHRSSINGTHIVKYLLVYGKYFANWYIRITHLLERWCTKGTNKNISQKYVTALVSIILHISEA